MKKLISFSLALVMMAASLFGFATVSFADETFVCGDNVNAVFNENTNTLTISGTGNMKNYTAFENPEWADVYVYRVETVVVEDGVTSIGDFAFANMNYLNSVTLPSTIESIGKRAFSSCLALTSITIPSSVKSIGEYALRTANNSQISNLETINVEEGNQYFCSVDGVLYNKDKTELIQIPPCVKITTLELPKTVETINSYSGQRIQNITQITIPESIKTIQSNAFDRAAALEKVVIESDKNVTISIDFLSNTNAVVQSFAGSPVETFATTNGISFEPLPYCILTFVDNTGKETKVEADFNASPEEINAPALPQAVSLDSKQHMAYKWNPTLETVTKNTTYTVEGFQENHTMVDVPDTAEKATIDQAGKYADSKCEDCGYYVKGGEIPQLAHYTITATAVNGNAVVQGVSELGNVKPNGEITLAATPAAEGLEFVGWSLNDKIVSTEETYTTVAIANADYVAIYKDAETEFTVVFTDQYGNVYGTWTGSDASTIDIPADPTLVGFTFKGWSMGEEAIKALDTSATIMAIFERTAADDKFNVTVNGDCTIDGTEEKTLAVNYNTQVTVNAPAGATNGTWKVDGAAVAYGTSYTFFVGADITLTFEEDASVTATPTVASVSMDKDANSFKVAFLATRSVVDGYKYISAGFVYGKNLTEEDLNLDNVGKLGSNGDSGNVKVLYCSTDSEQFRLSYGITAQTGSASVKPFLAYMNTDGETTVIYGATQTYIY